MAESALLVTVDSLRADFLGVAERHVETFAELNEAGLEFDEAYATGTGTGPSFPALLTGTLPLSYGGLGPLTDERPRLAAALSAAGVDTGGFQTNPFLSATFNYDVGFRRFEDYQNPLMGVATRLFPRGIESERTSVSLFGRRLDVGEALTSAYQAVRGSPRPYVPASVIVDDAVEWLHETGGPFFGWVHFMDVHHPCFPPEEYREAFGVGGVAHEQVADWYGAFSGNPEALSDDRLDAMERLYRASVAYVDDQIGRLVAALRHGGRFEETLFVVTSDHGELFGDHGQYGKPDRMYDELLHVPLTVVNAPDAVATATDDLVSLADVPPLVHDALGVDAPSAYRGRVPGRDDPREYVRAEMEVDGDPIVAARSRDRLYVGDEIRGEHRAYDLTGGARRGVDPNAADDALAPVRRAVHDRLGEIDPEYTRLEETVEGDVQSRLEDLGYL